MQLLVKTAADHLEHPTHLCAKPENFTLGFNQLGDGIASLQHLSNRFVLEFRG